MGLALTGKVKPYKVGFGPFPGEIYHAPFPNTLHGISVQDSLDAIEALFKTAIDPTRVAAIIIEPVQGEGGFNVTHPEFLHARRAICDRHGIHRIVDEIKDGFRRSENGK